MSTREEGGAAAGYPGRPAGRGGDALSRSRWIEHFGTMISVRAAGDEILDALAAFYAPYYRLMSGPAPREADLTLCLAVEGSPVNSAPKTDMRLYLAAPEQIEHVDGWQVMRRDGVDVTVTVDPGRALVRIDGAHPGEVELQARVLLRDQFLRQLERATGGVVFHAAAAVREGNGVAVMGERNAGKTTALISMLMSKEYDFVTADRLTLTRRDSGWPVLMAGVPARANIHAVAFAPGEPLEGLAPGLDRAGAVEGKFLVEIDTLTGHFGAGVVPLTELHTVILPSISPHVDTRVETVTSRERAIALVRQNLLEADEPGTSHKQWLDLPLTRVHPDSEKIEQLLGAIADHCEVVAFSGCYPEYVAWTRRRFGGRHE